MTSYEIVYFDHPGLAYLSRIMFLLARIPYKNVVADWPAEKHNMPYGRLPALRETNTDGSTFEICESAPIERYIAHKYGFLPQDLQQTAVLEQYVSQMGDGFATFVKYMFCTRNKENKKDLIDTLLYLLEKYDAILSASKSGYYFGNSITLADLSMYHLYKGVSVIEGLGVDIFSKSEFPDVMKLVDLAANHPGIQNVEIYV